MNMRTKRALALTLLLANAPAGASADRATQGTAGVLFFSDLVGINNDGIVVGGGCAVACSTYSAIRVTGGTLEFLGTLGGFAADAFDINNDGVIVGQADTAALDPNGVAISLAFLAAPGATAIQSLGSLPGYAHSQAFAVNDRGEIVGWAYNTDLTQPGGTAPTSRGFHIGPDGLMVDIGSFGGPTVARDINNQGVIVGSSRTTAGMTHAIVLKRGRMTALPGLGGRLSEALGINERGQIVGASTYAGSNAARAVLWDQGTIIDLGTLGGPTARASRISARGEIVGRARVAGGADHAFLYRDGTMHDLGTLGGRNSAAMDINDHGEIVGLSQTGEVDPSFGPVTRGFLVRADGVMRELRSVIDDVDTAAKAETMVRMALETPQWHVPRLRNLRTCEFYM